MRPTPDEWFVEWADTSSGRVWVCNRLARSLRNLKWKSRQESQESRDQRFTNQGSAHASAQYTTFITFELIHRKSGGKASRVAVF